MSAVHASWTLKDEDETHRVEYLCTGIAKTITVTIDGESFVLKTGFLHSPARNEIFRVGEERYLLVVDKKGRADVFLAGTKIEKDE